MTDGLTDRDVDTVAQYTAFEAHVELWKWQETSSAGFKVQLYLPTRSHLDAFDGVMKRRKGHAGHLYQCILSNIDTGNVMRQMESFFWGRNWSETAGASIALHFHGGDMEWWKQKQTRDQGDSETPGFAFGILMMEIDDDGTLINQSNARMVEAAHQREALKGQQPDPKPHGGPKSQSVARCMKETDFRTYLRQDQIHSIGGPFETFEDIDSYVKRTLNITSKVEMDQNAAVWADWKCQFRSPYLKWLGGG